jgi:hypothetical protein
MRWWRVIRRDHTPQPRPATADQTTSPKISAPAETEVAVEWAEKSVKTIQLKTRKRQRRRAVRSGFNFPYRVFDCVPLLRAGGLPVPRQ